MKVRVEMRWGRGVEGVVDGEGEGERGLMGWMVVMVILILMLTGGVFGGGGGGDRTILGIY